MTLTLQLVGGFIGLLLGGELLVRGASGIARRLGLSALVVGVVIVGFGTSTPELVTTVQAALAGAPGIAVGNIVGSNIANILLILGMAAVLCPFRTSAKSVIRDGSIVIATAIAFAIAAWTGTIERWVGIVFIISLVAYMAWALRSDRGEAITEDVPGGGTTPLWLSIVFVLIGLVVIVVGAHYLVDGAVEVARIFSVPEEVIGLTMVAVGTSLPELATTIIAAIRRHSQIALGNVLGSNVYNTIGIGGITATVAPIPVSENMMWVDIPLMLAISVLLVVVVATGQRVTRWEGFALLGLYVIYMAYQASFAGTAGAT